MQISTRPKSGKCYLKPLLQIRIGRTFIAVKGLYLGCEDDGCYCQANLQYLIQEYCNKLMRSQRDLGEYWHKFLKVASLLITTHKLSDMERDDLFLRGFPSEVEAKIQHWFSIVKSDLHPDNLYPIADTNDAAKFCLTGSAFRSSFQPTINVWPQLSIPLPDSLTTKDTNLPSRPTTLQHINL